MYPQADIFTHVYVPEMVSERIRRHRIIPTFINSLPRAPKLYKTYLPLMPLALEQLDLRGYDLVISSESGPAKGIIPPPDALHVCYCHTPMRYIWNMYHDYRNSAGPLTRLMMPPLAHYLRMWDVTVRLARRQLRCQLNDGREAHSSVLRRGIRRDPSARRYRRVFDCGRLRTRRLLFDGGRTRVLQAAGSRGARLQRDGAQSGGDRRRRNARRDSSACRARPSR